MYHSNILRMKNILYILLLLFNFTTYAQSKNDRTERIINFHSDIVIDTIGRITVTEEITIYAGGNEIKRGIVRQLPIYREDKDGNKIKIDIKLLSVLCNDNTTKYNVEKMSKFLDIYIGDENVFLSPGIYKYTIIYESYGHVGFSETSDELYWNVTGNDWEFSIDKASASITLPEGASSFETNCYTGKYSESQKECFSEEYGNAVSFFTTQSLKYKEGLTVSVTFTRDIIKRPPPLTEKEIFWNKYKRYICGGIGLLLFICYFLYTWIKVGRDPEKPVVIPQFKPPHDWSPAIVRYVYRKGFDDKIFTVSLISMAVKKAILISNEKRKYTLNSIEEKETLTQEEKTVYETLFASKQSVVVKNSDHALFSSTLLKLLLSLSSSCKLSDYLHRNLRYAFFGAILAFLIIILYKNITGIDTLFDWVTIGFIFLLFVIQVIYVYLIKAPTKLGAQTQSELEGLKMYLKTAEEDRWNALMPPEKTPELFEKLLPYAIALNVENEWCKKFDDILKLAKYNPDWYTGSKQINYSQFGNTFSNSFSSSLSSARISPSSSSSGSGNWSSGSGGGGFSGGGGGGGGVRGW